MAQSNFQDVVQLNQGTLSILGNQIQLDSAAGSKTIVFAQEPTGVTAINLIASNATGAESIIIPDANGTIGLITAIAAGGATFSNGGIVFSNSNSVSFGIAGSTLTASFAQNPTLVALSAGTQLNSTGTVVFSNSNGISFGMTNSSIITASADYIRSISAGGADATGNRIIFSNSNGVSFGANGATVTASIAAAAAVFGAGVSNLGNTLGNTGTTNGTIVFAGLGNITLSQVTAGGSLATITISGSQSTAPGGIAVAGSTITNGTVQFSNANGVTFGIAGSTVTASVAAQTLQSISAFTFDEWATNVNVVHSSLSLQKIVVPVGISATELVLLMAMSGQSNSSGAITISAAVYTLLHSTASLASSGTRQISWTSGALTTASSQYGGVSGTRYRSVGIGYSLSAGDYLLGIIMATTNDGTWRIFGPMGVNIVGAFDGVETAIFLPGVSNSSTGAFPASIANTNTNYVRTGLQAQRQPGGFMLGTI